MLSFGTVLKFVNYGSNKILLKTGEVEKIIWLKDLLFIAADFEFYMRF